ncbi:hypothetical protein QQG55_56580 [Brugia pahangi]
MHHLHGLMLFMDYCEIYPMWARSISVSIAAFCNWLFDIIASTSFTLLIRNIGRDYEQIVVSNNQKTSL